MTSGSLAGAYAKLTWAENRHSDMLRVFEEFAVADGGDGRPYGIDFDYSRPPHTVIVAKFHVDREMPEEISLLAGDVVHNARVALDHTLARLKEQFGGDIRQGSFPICTSESEWERRTVNMGDGNPLNGLDRVAVDLIYDLQPLHRTDIDPTHDPLLVVSKLDNADKHRLLHAAFAYPAAEEGLDLIEITHTTKRVIATNVWTAGQPIEHGTVLATYRFRGLRGGEQPPLRARREARLGYAIGAPDQPRASFEDIFGRVREVLDGAAALIAARSSC